MNVTIVVGGGAAGLISAYFSEKNGDKVVLLKKTKNSVKNSISRARAGVTLPTIATKENFSKT